jgi:transcriptional regulator with XRE-family HTH domain
MLLKEHSQRGDALMRASGADRGLRLAARIRAVRERYGLTQKQFAEQLGVSRSYLGKAEAAKGKPTIEMLVGIAESYPEVSTRWLLTGEGEMTTVDDVAPELNDRLLQIALYRASQIAKRELPDREVRPEHLSVVAARLYKQLSVLYRSIAEITGVPGAQVLEQLRKRYGLPDEYHFFLPGSGLVPYSALGKILREGDASGGRFRALDDVLQAWLGGLDDAPDKLR